jgi:hypothetical protein
VQQDISTFVTFQALVDKVLELFQVKIDPTEVLKEYYSLQQQAGESVGEFLLRFRAVEVMLDTLPAEEIQKRQFLKALREPLRSSFAMVDFSTVPLTEIVNKALNLNHQQLGLGLSQFRSIAPSLKAEEKAFQQALQCTVCLQFRHSNVECMQRCALCQARTHTTATCEYNLLAWRNAPAVQTVQPVAIQNRGQRDNNRFNNGNRGGRPFQRRGRPQFQNNSFRQEGADQRQEASPSRPQGNRRWD